MRLCKIENCNRIYYSLGWCGMHYARNKRHGNPETKLPIYNRNYQTLETRAKISATLKGRKKSLEMRMKLSNAKKGVNSLHFWKGGVTPANRIIRASTEYRQWRKAVFERDNYTCQLCGIRGGKLNADHIKKFADYPHLRLDINNGRTLCVPCHIRTPTFSSRGKRLQEDYGN